MILVQGRGRPRQERLSVSPFVALSVAPSDFFSPPKSSDKLSDQPAKTSGTKSPVANALVAATHISKYSKDDLQRIFKAVLEAQAPASALAPTPALAPASALAPAPALAPASIVSELPREKLKARSPDIYCEKSHIDCYNFCQQCEEYFATAGATGPIRILFATSFLWKQISFCWRQYKWRHDADPLVPVT